MRPSCREPTPRGGVAHTDAGVQRLGTGVDFIQNTDWFSSSYSLNVGWSLNGSTLFGIPSARAGAAATAARIAAAAFTLDSQVTLQYMTTLRARDGVEVATRQLDRARRNLDLVEVQVRVGAVPGIDAKQAEVDAGRAEVGLIQAEQLQRAEELLLMEQLGLSFEDGIELVSTFDIFDPPWSLEELIGCALARHPALEAAAAQERAGRANLRRARSGYFPTFSVSTGFRGSTNEALNRGHLIGQERARRESSFEDCVQWQAVEGQLGVSFPGTPAECGSPTLSLDEEASILAQNDVFPFDFTKSPFSVSFAVSIPVFNGFARERQIEQAEATARDAELARQAEVLRLRTRVTESFDGLESARRVVEIEERNREVAQERLTLATQRYALGVRRTSSSCSTRRPRCPWRSATI